MPSFDPSYFPPLTEMTTMDVSKLTLEIFSQLEAKWLADTTTKRKTRILSIDGGAGPDLKGLHAAVALVHLEDLLQSETSNPDARIPDFFDLLAGTGLGAVLAALLAAADPISSRPLFSARQALDFLLSNRQRLFHPSGLFRRRFSGTSFESVLRNALRWPDGRALTLRNTCRPMLVPCYDLISSAPFVFSSAGAAESPSFDFELCQVCRATSATPGLFRPCRISSADGRTAISAIDGGLVMNNPAAAAVTHVLHNKRDFPSVAGVEDLVVLSLGNAAPSPRPVTPVGCSTKDLIEIVLHGASGTVDQILGNAFCWNPMDYVRIQANGVEAEDDGERMLKERGVETLPFGGKRLLTETNGERIEALARRLAASDGGLPPSPSKDGAVNGC